MYWKSTNNRNKQSNQLCLEKNLALPFVKGSDNLQKYLKGITVCKAKKCIITLPNIQLKLNELGYKYVISM